MSSASIKHVIANPRDFEYLAGEHVIDPTGKYYYATVEEPGHVVMPEGVAPGDNVTVSYKVSALHRIPTPEPKRLPRSQRIPHLKRGGFKRR